MAKAGCTATCSGCKMERWRSEEALLQGCFKRMFNRPIASLPPCMLLTQVPLFMTGLKQWLFVQSLPEQCSRLLRQLYIFAAAGSLGCAHQVPHQTPAPEARSGCWSLLWEHVPGLRPRICRLTAGDVLRTTACARACNTYDFKGSLVGR